VSRGIGVVVVAVCMSALDISVPVVVGMRFSMLLSFPMSSRWIVLVLVYNCVLYDPGFTSLRCSTIRRH
jgi:hypothetical protein